MTTAWRGCTGPLPQNCSTGAIPSASRVTLSRIALKGGSVTEPGMVRVRSELPVSLASTSTGNELTSICSDRVFMILIWALKAVPLSAANDCVMVIKSNIMGVSAHVSHRARYVPTAMATTAKMAIAQLRRRRRDACWFAGAHENGTGCFSRSRFGVNESVFLLFVMLRGTTTTNDDHSV
ncbi:hypothetical protein BC828DRAFT_371834 [Blastocladiella britannica]|nr:hypothetical protein BC828DRAFT_371834 [Blastocladiella britannica]